MLAQRRMFYNSKSRLRFQTACILLRPYLSLGLGFGSGRKQFVFCADEATCHSSIPGTGLDLAGDNGNDAQTVTLSIGDRDMEVYHGTRTADAAHLAAGNVNTSSGGGELGMGFYTGEHLWAAKSWAFNKHRSHARNVVAFVLNDDVVQTIDIKFISRHSATFVRTNIKRRNATRTHLFGHDLIWSHIVGGRAIRCEQHKWESSRAEHLLNSAHCLRTVI